MYDVITQFTEENRVSPILDLARNKCYYAASLSRRCVMWLSRNKEHENGWAFSSIIGRKISPSVLLSSASRPTVILHATQSAQRKGRTSFLVICAISMLVLVHAPELLRILMTASSATARFLSLAVLLLSLAPLASLYVVFFSLLGVEPSSLVLLDQQQRNEEEWQAAAQAVVNQAVGGEPRSSSMSNPSASTIDWTQLTNNRTAFEELLKAMYSEASKHQPTHPLWMTLKDLSSPNTLSLIPPATAVLSQHWSIVIPWILTFILGVVVPMVLSLWSFWRQYRRGRQESAANNNKRRHKETLQRLQGFTKLLVPTDQVLEEEEDANTSGGSSFSCSAPSPPPTACPSLSVTDDESSAVAVRYPAEKDSPPPTQETLQWWLPLPGQKLLDAQSTEQQALRTIRGSCVICLNAYQLSETVSWSSNPGCVHHFHNQCIAKWLTRQVDCPCCRRVFLTHKVQHQQVKA